MKKLILLLLITTATQAQSISALVGYKAAEVNFKIEKELIYGIGLSITDANLVAKRANKNDGARNIHKANTNIMPSLFFLIGANFDEITIVGKLGGAYFNQSINGKDESQKFYRSVGVQLGYNNILASYDSSNSIMIGYNFNF